jgi:hypothetical protein
MMIFVAMIMAIRLIINVTVKRIKFLLHILEVTGSILGPVSGFLVLHSSWFYSFPQARVGDSTLHQTTTSNFQIFYISLSIILLSLYNLSH